MKQPLMEYLANKDLKANALYIMDGPNNVEGYAIAGRAALESIESVDKQYPTNAIKLIKWNDIEKGDNPNKKGFL